MLNFATHRLPNGLTLLVHEDHNTPLATVNLLYNVGARDEEPHRTGFAHLFEHLMFGGTKAVPSYDEVVDSLGGENNAFTNNDYTNYYLTFPAEHLERALWLEADRMRGLNFSQRSLEVQRQVVTEEYHQRYLGQPYGDVWLLLRPLAYREHPYRWNTIGADIRHVQEASLEEVEAFFGRYYRPDNCILAVAGNVKDSEVLELTEKHFGRVEGGGWKVELPRISTLHSPLSTLPAEPPQREPRRLRVERPVPHSALYLAFHMPGRLDEGYYACDLLTDILANGNSSRLYLSLVKELRLFTEIQAYITGDFDPGLLVVSGKLHPGVEPERAEEALWQELEQLRQQPAPQQELLKVQNKQEATFLFSQYKAADRALGLCYYQWIGRPEWVNDEPLNYRRVTPEALQAEARRVFRPENCSTLIYAKAQLR